VIPDVNFRNRLIAFYPSVMSGNLLNIVAASSFTPDLILTNANISNLSGIEYFTSIVKIDASINNLTSIPPIPALTSLKYLYLNYNQLTSLPTLNHLTNLLQIQVAFNNLTTIPAINNLSALQNLMLSDNQLTSMPDISNLTQLKMLIIGNNNFGTLPDFSPYVNLSELHCNQTGISEIKGLNQLQNLKKLYCWENSISSLADLNNNTSLTHLYAFDNKLTSLPTVSNKPNLNTIEIYNNALTFEDLLPVKAQLSVTSFLYSPQDSVGLYTKTDVRKLHAMNLSILEDATVTSNIYNWYKNNSSIAITTNGQYTVPSASTNDAGLYYTTITNPNLPLLTLTHRLWDISITNCVDVTAYDFAVVLNECSTGASINTNISLAGGTMPYTYKLTPIFTKDTIKNYTGDFTHIAPGQYTYSIRDANNCGLDTTAIIKKPNNCDPVITPNGDPQMSSYFIEQTGIAKIVDLKGNIIMQLNTPAVWYGTKTNGGLADAGYYVILVNNSKVTNITVIR
jgi:internalin A